MQSDGLRSMDFGPAVTAWNQQPVYQPFPLLSRLKQAYSIKGIIVLRSVQERM
jgi:hypothetical protein